MTRISSYKQIEAMIGLHDLHYNPEWSAAPDFLATVIQYCNSIKPETIVECSSGTSSIVLAKCYSSIEDSHVYSLEHESHYANITRTELEKHNLGDRCTILESPLIDYSINSSNYLWYQLDKLNINNIDMLVIDGPPGFIQTNSRYPAVPLLIEKLSDNAFILLDDASRDDERNTVLRWTSETSGLIEVEYLELERGCSVLKYNK